MPAAKLLRRHAGALAELLGEGALITETVVQRDLDDGVGGLGESFSGGLNAGTQQELVGTEAEGSSELAVQVAF